jgi:hypothetical protein
MSRGTVNIPNLADVNASKLAVEFMSENEKGDVPNSAGGSTLTRWATDVVLVSGESPSYAFFSIPQIALEEIAGKVAASYSSSPKLYTRARVTYVEDSRKVPLLVGSICRYQHDIRGDSVVGMIQDDRLLLTKCTVFGRVKMDPQASEEDQVAWLDAAEPLIFEPLSCVDTPYGPLFAPSFKYGHAFMGGTPVPAPGEAKKAARNWRCVDAWNYLRNVYGGGHSTGLTFDTYGNIQASKYVFWEDGLCDSVNWQRWCSGLELENESLLSAMQKVCRQSGPFDVYMEPAGWKGTVRITDMSGRKGTASLYLPRYYPGSDVGTLMSDPNAIVGGNLVENGCSYFHGVSILGDPPTVERIFDTQAANKETYSQGIQGWSTEDEDAFRKIVTDGGDTKEAFLSACDQYPNVFCLYRIDPNKGKIFPDGSAYVNDQPHWYTKIKASLLSSKTANIDGAQQSNSGAGSPADWFPLEIPVELGKDDPDNPGTLKWTVCDRLDGLAISSDRTMIYLDGLRRRGSEHLTWDVNSGDGPYKGSSMSANKIRMTVAMESDSRIVKSSRKDPCRTSNRVRSDEKYDWVVVSRPTDYVFWERWKSYPYGQEVDVDPDFVVSDKLGTQNALFSDLDRLQRHVDARLKDVKRISYSGEMIIARLNPSLKPGMAVDIRGSVLEDGDNGGAIVQSWSYSALDQQQVVQLAADDRQRIYDVPTGAAKQYSAPPPPQKSDIDKAVDQIAAEGKPAAAAQSSTTGGPSYAGPVRESAYTEETLMQKYAPREYIQSPSIKDVKV